MYERMHVCAYVSLDLYCSSITRYLSIDASLLPFLCKCPLSAHVELSYLNPSHLKPSHLILHVV